MYTKTLHILSACTFCLALALPFLQGCGNSPLQEAKGGDAAEDTLSSTIEDPTWGTFELLATGQNPETGKHDFVVRSTRSVAKNQFRFVWDFGNGPEGEGLQQSYGFDENGTYLITVTAYTPDDDIAFVLKLTIDVGVANNLAPIAQVTAEEQAGENALVFLYGGSSSDPDGDELTYRWLQLSGPPVQILHANEASASFITPQIDEDQELGFRLNVSDGELTGHSDVVVLVSKLVDDENPEEEGPVGLDLNGDGLMDSEDARINCIESGTEWDNLAFFPQNGVFEITFSTVPKIDFMDAVVGLSATSINRFSGAAVLVRFNPGGTIDVRNGGAYNAESELYYAVGKRYYFRVVVNVPAHTYSVFAQPEGEDEIELATNYAFRTEQNTVTSLGFWNLWSDVGTTIDLCKLRINAASLTANAGADVTISPGGSTVLKGEATGGQGPYLYSWSPATGLNDARIATPTATPTQTTVYTLTVTDVWGVSRTDTVTVSLRAGTLAAKAGDDQEIPASGSVQLDGSATGGTAPYTYKWSPTTGLSSSTVANPTSRPAATTTYLLTVTDSTGASASDAMVVTVAGGDVGDAFVVAQGAANASDSNAGTEAAPWKTLAKAASTAKAGQTVLIKAGTYNETLRPAYSGAAEDLITFKAFPGDECQGAMGQPKVADSCKVDITKSVDLGGRNYIRIEGFEIRNTSGAGVKNTADWYATSYQSTGNQLVNNYIHDTGADGIDSQNSSGLLAENNEIYNTGTSGLRFGGQMSSENLTARGNNLHHIGKDGFQGGCNNCVFELNQMYDSVHTAQHQDAFDIGWITNSIIRYNRISDFTQLIYGGAGSGSSQPWENLQIYGNVLFTDKYWTEQGSEAPGIWIDQRVGNGATRNITIHSNTFGWLGYGAIWIEGGGNPVTGIKVYNNIFYEASIDVSGGGITSDYNLFYGMGKPSFEGSHSTIANPQFVNYSGKGSTNFDFRLKTSSPAINKGAPDLGSKVTLPPDFRDMGGQSRPHGGGFDFGAYEGG